MSPNFPPDSRELYEYIGDAVSIARQAPAHLLWCPKHPREMWFSEGVMAPKRCCACQRLLVLKPADGGAA